MSEWELLKENVEPIKSGRSIKTLKSALNEKPCDVTARDQKKSEFESDLRTYEGSDPLSVYYEYICWVEQNYPLGGFKDFKELLEKCVEQYYSSEQYMNDKRLLEVFLKLIKRVDSPLELFAFFNDNGFALQLADFYINWAFHLENSNNCRKAQEILQLGLLQSAEPRDALDRAVEQLEIRVAKAIVNDKADELNDNNEALQRVPLNKLKAKSKAPVKRVGNAIKKNTKGLQPKSVANVNNAKNQKPTQVYCDENDPIPVKPEPKPADPPKPPTAKTAKSVKAIITGGQENEQKPGKWNENSLAQKIVPKVVSQPKFDIHADEDEAEESPEPVRKPQTNALKVRNPDSPPIVRFEKPDPFKKYAFNINKLYAGTEEFSFEEIRGRKWMARKKREEEALRNKKLEEEVEQLRRTVELLLKQQQMAQQVAQPVPQPTTAVPETKATKERTASPVPSSAESSTAKSGTNSSGNATNNAMSMLREMWDGTLGTLGNATADEMNPRLDINAVIDRNEQQIQKQSEAPFAIFSDETFCSNKMKPSRVSTGFADYTIALPRSEETFFARASNFSTPVSGKGKRESQLATAAEPPPQSHYNYVGGMTAKLTPIVETSREYNSKSSSSSSGARTTMSCSGPSGRSSGLSRRKQ